MTQSLAGLDTLLELDGSVFEQDAGFWIKIEAKKVEASPHVPHGIKYSLTLHDRNGTRVLGYDNAHALKPKWKFNHAGRRLTFDHKHRHRTDRGVTYAFSTGYRLLADFFDEVDVILRRERGS